MNLSSDDQRNSLFMAVSDIDSVLSSHTDHVIDEHNNRLKELKTKKIKFKEKITGKGTDHPVDTISIFHSKVLFKSGILVCLIFFIFSQFNLGDMYENGRGVLQDYKESVKWFTKATEQRDASVQYNLGDMYENGQGVP